MFSFFALSPNGGYGKGPAFARWTYIVISQEIVAFHLPVKLAFGTCGRNGVQVKVETFFMFLAEKECAIRVFEFY